ncbi:motility protein A, partial [Bacillus vallismortis]|nr:motility protein A [Bacillus vallismortis]
IAAKLEVTTESVFFITQVMVVGIIGIQSGKIPRNLESQLVVFSSRAEWRKQPNQAKAKNGSVHEA